MARAKMSDLPVDPTAWMIDNDVSNFLLLHQKEVLYMCMVSVVNFVSLLTSTRELTCALFVTIRRSKVGIHLPTW